MVTKAAYDKGRSLSVVKGKKMTCGPDEEAWHLGSV